MERVESPDTYVTELVSRGHFCLVMCFFLTALSCSGGYHLDRGGMPLHDAVGELLNIKAEMSSIWATGCMLMIMCVI